MDNAELSVTESRVEESTVVTVSCLESHVRRRYVLLGEKEVTCKSNREWSTLPKCSKCGTYRIHHLDFLPESYRHFYVEFFWITI